MSLKVGELFGTLDLDSEPFRKKLAVAGDRLGALTSVARSAALAGGMAMAVGAGAAALAVGKIGMSYQDSLNVFQSVSQANSAQMAAVGQRAKDLGNDMSLPGVSAAGAATAMTELAKAGLSVEQSMAAAKGVLQLSKAATVDEGTAAQMTASALNAFSLGGDQAVRVADLLAAAANSSMGEITDMGYAMSQSAAIFASAGVSVEDLTASIAMLANKGILGSDAGTSLKTMLMSLQAPTGAAKDALDGLGVSLYNADGSTRGYRETIDSMSQALAPLTDAQKAQKIETIFGSDAARAANIIFGQGVAVFDKQREAVTKQGAAAEVAAAKSKGLSGALENIKSIAETAAINIFENYAGDLENTARKAGDVATTLADIWAKKDFTISAKTEMSVDELYRTDEALGRISAALATAAYGAVIFGETFSTVAAWTVALGLEAYASIEWLAEIIVYAMDVSVSLAQAIAGLPGVPQSTKDSWDDIAQGVRNYHDELNKNRTAHEKASAEMWGFGDKQLMSTDAAWEKMKQNYMIATQDASTTKDQMSQRDFDQQEQWRQKEMAALSVSLQNQATLAEGKGPLIPQGLANGMNAGTPWVQASASRASATAGLAGDVDLSGKGTGITTGMGDGMYGGVGRVEGSANWAKTIARTAGDVDLVSRGESIIRGLGDGMGNMMGWLGNKAGEAAQLIKDHLPNSPAKKGPLSGMDVPFSSGKHIAGQLAGGLLAGTRQVSGAMGTLTGAVQFGSNTGGSSVSASGAPGGGSASSQTTYALYGPVTIVANNPQELGSALGRQSYRRTTTTMSKGALTRA